MRLGPNFAGDPLELRMGMRFEIATLTTIALVASTAVTAYSAYQQGQAQSKADDFNAAVARNNSIVAENNAQSAKDAAAESESDVAYKAKLQLGAEKSAAGASGIDPNSGSPLQLMTDTAQQTTLDALRTRYQGDLAATNYRNQSGNAIAQSQLDKMNAQQDVTGGFEKAGASILNGATSYGMWQSRYGTGNGNYS